MSEKILDLIAHANDLQDAVNVMLKLERRDGESARQFLSTLVNDDFLHLMKLNCDQKILYLERRFKMYSNGLGR
jgi:hypothetical protein